ncbi:serine hydrolase domain-containing protein [Corallincola spongiicola]|uniref:Class A beta-lactamase-related serine hydrolase n=1 Tax=Corallincola spongiicola TaxID=2520508 RepID=A0ABY1WN90_9GAMM|nr:serine hydrolase domain-containing protein [Corallincola spongiicola]TAA45023.1 class A beta-lactamase-related serine hydrolase [Corallincola spongiicola]
MRFSLFTFFSLLLTHVPAVAASTAAPADQQAQFLKSFNQHVSALLADKSIPGGAYAIIKDDQVVEVKTFGHLDMQSEQPVTPDTVFRLASVSKPFAATITTMLAHEKQLDLDAPITQYVPEFHLATPGAAKKIKVKHVLSHTTGLVPNAYDNLLHEKWSMEKVIRRFERVVPVCQPAQCYGYQNIAYGFLEPAIEQSQQQSYEALLEQRLFTPLGMANASLGLEKFRQAKNSAKPHVLINKVNTGKKDRNGKAIKSYVWRTVKVTPDYYKVATAAGINASITDLSKWLIANLGHAPKVLTPALIAELTEPRIRTRKDLKRKHWRDYLEDAHYGYGWRIYQFKDYPIIYHSGWVQGFRADIGYSPTLGVGFAVLINAESNSISEISTEFWSQAYKLTDEKPAKS